MIAIPDGLIVRSGSLADLQMSLIPHVCLPPKADIKRLGGNVRFVPEGDIALAHSITSSAVESSDCGTVRPSALAVLRLITVWYLVGACTGKSAGFSPFKMRST